MQTSAAARSSRCGDHSEPDMRTFVLLTVMVSFGIASAQSVTVSGQVARPGTYLLGPQATVLHAIAVAGGLLSTADAAQTVLSRANNATAIINITDIIRSRTPDVPLQDGDEI
jgi:protein involved in polysaccharide export with SLBB domain